MYIKRFLFVLVSVSTFLVTASLVSTNQASAGNEAVLYSFCASSATCPDGAFPFGAVTVDSKGHIFSTTYKGGGPACSGYGCGEVFEMGLTPKGTWAEEVIHSFTGGVDGAYPYVGVVFDAAGNLYGTTDGGGLANSGCNAFYGCGVAYELTPNGSGQWTETILYYFCSLSNCEDGESPAGSLILDAAGNLYGTTAAGGGTANKDCPGGCGTVFELKKQSDGTWAELPLYRFKFSDGAFPEANLIFDAAGNLYGTTSAGGTYGFGTVFELSPGTGGTWTEKVLWSFNSTDGKNPLGGVVLDKSGNLYGTTFTGGTGAACVATYGCGTVFELTLGSGGQWTEQVLYNFCATDTGICTDGANPYGSVFLDGANHLLGTTSLGGTFGTSGTIFLLTQHNGTWSHGTLHDFGVQTNDGANPQAGLTFDAANGIFYGSTAGGGNSTNCNTGQGCGTVYSFSLGTGEAESK